MSISGSIFLSAEALFNQAGYGSRELAVCIRDHIVTELRRLHRQIQSIETVLGGRLPFSDEEDMRSLVE